VLGNFSFTFAAIFSIVILCPPSFSASRIIQMTHLE